MRVALLSYSTRIRDDVVHTLSLAEALAARGVQVTVWSIGRSGDETVLRPVDPRVQVRAVAVQDRDGQEFGARIVRFIAELSAGFAPFAGDYDVVHAQDSLSANAAGPRRHDVVRTVDHVTTGQLAECHERALVDPRTHVCVSAAVADEIATGWGIRATVIPNGVDAARFAAAATRETQPARARWQSRLGPYVLAVGGIEPRKGTDDLVEVEPVLLGPVDHDALPSLVAAAEVFAFPSVQEGFGLAALEALAAGVPVVCRELPVLREVLGDAATCARDVPTLATTAHHALYRSLVRQ